MTHMINQMELSHYKEYKPHRFKRLIWLGLSNSILRLFVGGYLRYIYNIVLRSFGAKIPLHVMIYPSAKIFAPWNLIVGNYVCIGPKVEVYNKDKIIIGNNSIVSQNAKLYTAGHDITSKKNTLITAPIIIGNNVWIGADAFVGMGVTINEGAVVGARAAVFKNIHAWEVVGGNPAKFIKKRIIEH